MNKFTNHRILKTILSKAQFILSNEINNLIIRFIPM